jgi:hypothetical protein
MQPETSSIEPKSLLASWIKELSNDGYNSVHLAHFGVMNQDLVNSFTENMEEYMISAGEKKTLLKRMFSILIEGLQNILIHGLKLDNELQSLVIIAHNNQAYRVVLGNLTHAKDIEKLTGYLERLNQMSDEEVKEFYLQSLNNGIMSEKGGAGLGFITMRMKSKAKLDYQFLPVSNDVVLFSIASSVAKE